MKLFMSLSHFIYIIHFCHAFWDIVQNAPIEQVWLLAYRNNFEK